MSRFSKAEAEKLGWTFYHDSDEVVLNDGNNESGVSKVVPASVRAEKFIDLPGVDQFRTTEEAPTLGLLLERINSFEEHLKARLAAPSAEADARPADEEPIDFAKKQLAKQKAENERVLGDEAAEGLSPGEPGAEDEDLSSLTVDQLKGIAKEKGLSTRGRKATLVKRIKAAKK